MDVTEAELGELYTWVDEIPLSRPKKNIARDFSDGVLMAEIVHHYFPKHVELHNYSSANGTQQKMYNWNTLNQRVCKRLGFTIPKAECEAVANCQPGAVERTLKLVQAKLRQAKEEGHSGPTSPTGTGPAAGAAAVVSAGPRPPTYPGAVDQAAAPGAAHHPAHGPGTSVAMRNQLGIAVPKGMSGSISVPTEVLVEKDQAIAELRETNEILETKVRKLEQLVRLKDAKIATLMAKLQSAGLT